ncbi:unnamed protein product [Rotaria magnacalcarata]|uniref:Reverse transcriptase domain-containing protein n=2 Tax=Rotaria magnacalcarata TaxID=392030 RepID=A0A816M3H4_9BILA|nr:unnamed protein product [Rotaria magnacalcarata]CAF4404723.1 unnamed protein product [Rotaria magnacalcarata]
MVMERSREFNQPLHICFIDLQKAYDLVNREALWRVCRAYGLSDKMIKLLYDDVKAEVRIDGDFSSSIQMNTGVKQGCLLSPILFNVYIDFVMRQILEQAGTEGIIDRNEPKKSGSTRLDSNAGLARLDSTRHVSEKVSLNSTRATELRLKQLIF